MGSDICPCANLFQNRVLRCLRFFSISTKPGFTDEFLTRKVSQFALKFARKSIQHRPLVENEFLKYIPDIFIRVKRSSYNVTIVNKFLLRKFRMKAYRSGR